VGDRCGACNPAARTSAIGGPGGWSLSKSLLGLHAQGRVIIAHLGEQAGMAAIHGGPAG
jgi:hypothetical protein